MVSNHFEFEIMTEKEALIWASAYLANKSK
jgi:hypothetical protein